MWYRGAQSAQSRWVNAVFNNGAWKFFGADGKLVSRSNDFKSMVPYADPSPLTQARVQDILKSIEGYRQMSSQGKLGGIAQQFFGKYSDPEWYPETKPATPAQPAPLGNVTPQGETDSQRRYRYTQAYAAAYEQYQATPPQNRMPFQQWKAQFDQSFNQGRVLNPASQPTRPLISGEPSQYVTTQNQSQGTYKLVQDAAGNVQIQQADGRVYAFIPAAEVPYQGEYIKRMTGQAPRPSQKAPAQVQPATK
jgi:hypothetical protein